MKLLVAAIGTGKTVTAVSDAKSLGERTLFLGHTKELVSQAKRTFDEIWNGIDTGLYVAEENRMMLTWFVLVYKVWYKI